MYIRTSYYYLSILKIGVGRVLRDYFASNTFTGAIALSFARFYVSVMQIWCFCMQVGTTSSTAVDPLPELGNIAKVSTFFSPLN